MDQLYKTWVAINHRCHGKGTKDKIYQWYRDRGITVCDEWRGSYFAFRDWALSHGFVGGLTIDRIDGDGNYCPENCRWVTRSENSKNKKPRPRKPKQPKPSSCCMLTEEEQMSLISLMEALEQLPEEKKHYILGYAEAIADIKSGKITVEKGGGQ